MSAAPSPAPILPSPALGSRADAAAADSVATLAADSVADAGPGSTPRAVAASSTGSSAALVTAHATIQHHSKSFSLAARILPPACRDDAAVVYTYCRRVDDAVDEVPAAEAAAAVVRLRAELDELYAGRAVGDPVLARFATIVADRRIPRHYPAELIAGMEMDAVGTPYDTLERLLQYSYRVAGVVGLMMCHVLGVRDDAALVPAVHLGIAMQLTNICRDVGEDWQRRRLYLPDELLARHGAGGLGLEAAAGRPLPATARAAVAATTAELLAIAERYYRSADRGIPALGWRSAFGVRAARKLYAAIGGRVAAAGFDPLAARAVVPRWKKLGLVGVAALGTIADAPRRLLSPAPRVLPTTTLELSDVDRV